MNTSQKVGVGCAAVVVGSCMLCVVVAIVAPPPPTPAVAASSATPASPTPRAAPSTNGAAATPPGAPAAPPAPAAGSASIRERLTAGEAVPPLECLAQTEARNSPTSSLSQAAADPWVWVLAQCAWDANERRDDLAFDIDSMGVRGAPPAEAARLLAAARKHIADHPSILVNLEPISLLNVPDGRFVEELAVLSQFAERYPAATRSSAFRNAKRTIEERREMQPVPMRDLRQLQLAYADMQGRYARISGYLEADTYYNCAFNSSSRWRSFRFKEGLLSFSTMHVYCERGNAGCERLYAAASRDEARREMILRYPTSNRICEGDQAELVEAR